MKLFKDHKPKTPATQRAPLRPRSPAAREAAATTGQAVEGRTKELGGPEGPEPTRYGDWERKGICYDF